MAEKLQQRVRKEGFWDGYYQRVPRGPSQPVLTAVYERAYENGRNSRDEQKRDSERQRNKVRAEQIGG